MRCHFMQFDSGILTTFQFFCPLLIQTIATVSKVPEFFTERSLHPLPAATTAEAHSVDSLLASSLACHPYAAKEHMVMC